MAERLDKAVSFRTEWFRDELSRAKLPFGPKCRGQNCRMPSFLFVCVEVLRLCQQLRLCRVGRSVTHLHCYWAGLDLLSG